MSHEVFRGPRVEGLGFTSGTRAGEADGGVLAGLLAVATEEFGLSRAKKLSKRDGSVPGCPGCCFVLVVEPLLGCVIAQQGGGPMLSCRARRAGFLLEGNR